MDTNKPMALRLADKYEHEGFLSDHKFAQNQWCSHAAVELRRLHAENTALQSGYDAAWMEVAILHNRLEASQKTNDDWAKRTHAMDAKNLGLLHALTAEQDENHALHQQLAAIGAGGVEPLRKRECIHQIIEPAPSEWDVRGHLAASLTCWPRLTGQEAAELVALFQGRPEQAYAPVVLPAPDAVLRFERSTAGKENEMPIVVSCNWLPDGEYKLYTEQQVRTLLATVGQALEASPIDADAQRDAERYRWLRNEETDWYVGPSYSTYNDNVCDGEYRNFFGVELDKAIDAASAAQGGV